MLMATVLVGLVTLHQSSYGLLNIMVVQPILVVPSCWKDKTFATTIWWIMNSKLWAILPSSQGQPKLWLNLLVAGRKYHDTKLADAGHLVFAIYIYIYIYIFFYSILFILISFYFIIGLLLSIYFRLLVWSFCLWSLIHFSWFMSAGECVCLNSVSSSLWFHFVFSIWKGFPWGLNLGLCSGVPLRYLLGHLTRWRY